MLAGKYSMGTHTFDPVDAQLAAYNARDVEAFLACYRVDPASGLIAHVRFLRESG